jgi:hypothetical protein
MFQYLVSALATGATVVMYEGSPLKRPESMWETIDELGVTVFGTSAKYIEQISVCPLIYLGLELMSRNTTLTSSRNIAYRLSVKSSLLVHPSHLISSTSYTRISSPTFSLGQLRVVPIFARYLLVVRRVFPCIEARSKPGCLACESSLILFFQMFEADR